MADKERDQRVRRRDQIRQLEEKLNIMEMEKRKQQQEMQEMLKKLEMEEKIQMEQVDMGVEYRHTDPLRRSLNFDREIDVGETTDKRSSLAYADLRNLRSGQSQQNTTEPSGVVVQKTYSASAVKSIEQQESADELLESSSHQKTMADHLDQSLFRLDKPYASFDDQDSARESPALIQNEKDVGSFAPNVLYERNVTESSHGQYDDWTSQKLVSKEDDSRSVASAQNKSYLVHTPSIQKEIDQERILAEQRRKALLEESARLKKEREMLHWSIKKERMKDDFVAQQRRKEEQLERERREVIDRVLHEERMNRRQEEKYRESMLERQRQMYIEERDKELRDHRDRLDRVRHEIERDVYQRRTFDERPRQEAEQRWFQRELTEETEEEDMFERQWKKKKDSIRKEMTTDQLKEERELLEEIHRLKCRDVDTESQSNVRLAENRLLLLRKEKEELLEKMRTQNSKKHTVSETLKQEEPIDKTVKQEKAIGKLKLQSFDGSQFEGWKLEVTSLIECPAYSEHSLTHIIRNSITGKARKVLLTLKPSATTSEILKKMEDIYGNIRSGYLIVQEFYSAKQLKDEPCSEWGIRLETLFNQTVERGEIQESRKDAKLKERFWRGLISEKIKLQPDQPKNRLTVSIN